NFLPELNISRIGLEVSLSSDLTIGSLNNYSSGYRGNVMFLREHSSDELSIGERAGRSGFAGYGTTSNDAGCTPTAIKWVSSNGDSPGDILQIMNYSSSKDYTDLAREISSYSSNPIAAF